MRKQLCVLIAGAAIAIGSGPVSAHHGFSAEFDADAPVSLQGKISKIEWINPHSWIHVEVKNKEGVIETWAIEGGTPNTLMRRGITRDSLPVGTEILITGYRSRDGGTKANGRDITYLDGRKLFMGSENTGAPSDK